MFRMSQRTRSERPCGIGRWPKHRFCSMALADEAARFERKGWVERCCGRFLCAGCAPTQLSCVWRLPLANSGASPSPQGDRPKTFRRKPTRPRLDQLLCRRRPDRLRCLPGVLSREPRLVEAGHWFCSGLRRDRRRHCATPRRCLDRRDSMEACTCRNWRPDDLDRGADTCSVAELPARFRCRDPSRHDSRHHWSGDRFDQSRHRRTKEHVGTYRTKLPLRRRGQCLNRRPDGSSQLMFLSRRSS